MLFYSRTFFIGVGIRSEFKNSPFSLVFFFLAFSVFAESSPPCPTLLGKGVASVPKSEQAPRRKIARRQVPFEVEEHGLYGLTTHLLGYGTEHLVPVVVIERFRNGDFVTEVTRIERRTPDKAPPKESSDFNLKSLRRIQKEAVEFALENYKRRGWDKKLMDKFRNVAREHALNSTYIKVYQEAPKAKPELVGTMRLVRSGPDLRAINHKEFYKRLGENFQTKRADWIEITPRYEQLWQLVKRLLPLERYFKILLPRPMLRVEKSEPLGYIPEAYHFLGEIIEPGVFAIKKDVNAKVTQAIFKQVVDFGFDPANSPEYNFYGKVFYTYGDRQGQNLYRLIGFEPVKDRPSYWRGGVEWQILRATPAKVFKWARRIIERPNMSEAEAEEIRDLVEALSLPAAYIEKD